MTPSHRRVFGLDLLRAVACLLVMVQHSYPAIHHLSFCGFLGVELFFVLSGFLIGGILIRSFEAGNDLSRLRDFWLRRWFRTLPTYFLFLGIYSVVSPLVPGVGVPPHDWWRFALFVQNLTTPPPPFFGVSWSLAVEEWFYLLVPVVLLVLLRISRNARRACLMTIFGVIALSSAAYVWYALTTSYGWHYGLRKIVVLRFGSLMMGVLGAYLARYRPALWRDWRRPAALLSAGMFAFVALLFIGVFPALRTALILMATSTAALLALPALDHWKEGRFVGARAVTMIAIWSYALYLCHPLVFLTVARRPHLWAPAALALKWMGSIALAAAVYTFFGRPTTQLRERFAPADRRRPLSA